MSCIASPQLNAERTERNIQLVMNRYDPVPWNLEEAGDTSDCLPATIHKGSGLYQDDLRVLNDSPNKFGVSVLSESSSPDPTR
jgi:hypothetical protein